MHSIIRFEPVFDLVFLLVISACFATHEEALWQRKRARRYDSDGADSNVIALTVTALGHQW